MSERSAISRTSRPGAVAAALPVFLFAAATTQVSDCRIDLRAGSRQVPERLPVVDGSPAGPMENGGLSLGLGGSCQLTDRLRVGPQAEAHFDEKISFYNFLGAARLPLVRSSRLEVSVEGASGWALSGHGMGDSILQPPRDALVLEPGETSGPVVGSSLRVGVRLPGRFRVFANAGWRAMFLERVRYGTYGPRQPTGGPRLGTRPETVHLLPITAGLEVTL